MAIRHVAQQRITRTAASSTTKHYVRDARHPYYLLRIQIDTRQLIQLQWVKLIDSTKCRRLRWCSKLNSSKQQHSVQIRIIRTYAGTRYPLRRQVNVKIVLVQLP